MRIPVENSPLGQRSHYVDQYDPTLLFAVPRAPKREALGLDPAALPFIGVDVWNHYEVSWLNDRGKPMVATAEIRYNCDTPCIVESKSLKLYFNSFNQTRLASVAVLEATLARDLSACVGGPVSVSVHVLSEAPAVSLITELSGICIDSIDIDCDTYHVNPELLRCEDQWAEETLYSHLLKSNCLVTHQPDWGSVLIQYSGPKLDHAALLQYLISFRHHNEFHEQCIERIFTDILRQCRPAHLTVYGRYTRRGGLDINPYRTTDRMPDPLPNPRLRRQ